MGFAAKRKLATSKRTGIERNRRELDHGIGIPRDKQEKIFERFYRIDDPNLGPQPGTGLGLFISRELAERHGGSLIVERSEAGKGSIFVLRLPAATAPHPSGLLVNLPSAPIIA